MKVLLTLVVLLLLQQSDNKSISASQVELAIDCGSFVEYKTEAGITYQKDQYYSDSKVADYSLDSERNGVEIRFTKDQGLYFTERHQDYNFHYDLPLRTEGKFVIILRFTELYFQARGKRQFNINIGERTVRGNVDIAAEVQKNSAFDLYLPIEVRNSQVFYNSQVCQGGYDKYKRTVNVEFEKIEGRDNPKVDGIMVVKGGLQDTDYYETDQMRKSWIQTQEKAQAAQEEERVKGEMARLRKKEKTRQRHDDLDEEEEEEEDDEE